MKSLLGDDAAVLAPSSGEEPASPRHRAGVASMAWRSTRRFRTNAPYDFDFHTGRWPLRHDVRCRGRAGLRGLPPRALQRDGRAARGLRERLGLVGRRVGTLLLLCFLVLGMGIGEGIFLGTSPAPGPRRDPLLLVLNNIPGILDQ